MKTRDEEEVLQFNVAVKLSDDNPYFDEHEKDILQRWLHNQLTRAVVELKHPEGLHGRATEVMVTPVHADKFDLTPVVVESPYSGDVEANLTYLRRAMRDCFQRGEAPFASHGLYTQEGVLDDNDPEERAKGIQGQFLWGKSALYTVVYMDRGCSWGMAEGVYSALLAKRQVVLRWLDHPAKHDLESVLEVDLDKMSYDVAVTCIREDLNKYVSLATAERVDINALGEHLHIDHVGKDYVSLEAATPNEELVQGRLMVEYEHIDDVIQLLMMQKHKMMQLREKGDAE